MLDLRAVRRDAEPVRAALARRRDGSEATLERVLALDVRRRELLPEIEALRARQNEASAAIGRAKQAGRDAAEEIGAMQEVARRVKVLGEELAGVEADLDAALAALPNPPDPTAADEDETLREVGAAGAGGPDHLEIAGGLIDMEAGARVAGSRFAYLKGDLVLLELALVRWALEELRERGFEPVVPPVLVREEALHGTGFLPDTEQQIYRLADDPLYLVGTSEVAAGLAARRRDPRRGPAAAALRRLLAVLPARGRRGGARHARDLPRAPVRQGRDVRVRRAGATRSPSTSACSRSRSTSCRRSASPTAW